MELFFMWVVLSVVAGVVGAARNRSGTGYFLLSLLLTPLVGLLLAALLPNPGPPDDRAEADRPRVRCTICAELVMADALKCKHCGADMAAQRRARAEEQARGQPAKRWR